MEDKEEYGTYLFNSLTSGLVSVYEYGKISYAYTYTIVPYTVHQVIFPKLKEIRFLDSMGRNSDDIVENTVW